MQRRALLRRMGALIGMVAGGSAVAAAGDDADPRPSPNGGTQPNTNVPTVETGALGEAPFDERSEIPAGNWIRHNNAWILGAKRDRPEEYARYFANNTTQRYTIDGETFVYDSFDDWTYEQVSEDSHRIGIEYVTPPKPRGTSYEVRWEFEADTDDPTLTRWERIFPFSNQIEIVGRR